MNKGRIATILLLAATPLAASPAEDGAFATRVLTMHNGERKNLGIAPLAWSPELAAQARQWAMSLARRRTFEHSSGGSGQGENLWMGMAGYYSPEDMIGGFLAERRWFRPGVFPRVSRTGRWSDVGHYSQIVWPATRQVGCALARGGGDEYLVCRYWPAGNVMGQRVP
jgi:uncharacterized protein YkwD